jgi:cobalt-zinc-cadmium efflux system membrane fusion protein
MKAEWMRAAVALILAVLLVACGPSPQQNESHDDHDEQAYAGEEHEQQHGDEEEGEHHEEAALALDPEMLSDSGVELAVAGPGIVEITAELPGEVHLDQDRMAHVSSRVGGVAIEVHKSLGDAVQAGELLAVLESRELADSKAAYLAGRERLALAEATASREQRLWQQRVSAEQDYLDARVALAEARIELRASEQKLRALGLGDNDLQQVVEEEDSTLTHYRILAPFAGEVIDKHLTLGETVAAETTVFTVADLDQVWIDLQVFQKDLGAVRAGQDVRIFTNHASELQTTIDLVQPLVGETTRTALARIVAGNRDGMWHPGCFVTALVVTETVEVPVRVPRSALIRLEDGDMVVFVEDEHGLEPRPVTTGRSDHDHVEVTGGLQPGEHYVARGAFALKAELGKGSFGHGHAH